MPHLISIIKYEWYIVKYNLVFWHAACALRDDFTSFRFQLSHGEGGESKNVGRQLIGREGVILLKSVTAFWNPARAGFQTRTSFQQLDRSLVNAGHRDMWRRQATAWLPGQPMSRPSRSARQSPHPR